jgi:uncharacterized protein YkwD
MRLVAGLLLVVPSLALASPAARYNEPTAPSSAHGTLEASVEALVAEVAVAQRREPPRPDPRLARAAADLVRVTPPDGRPSNEVVQAALWLNGILEPPPHLILASMTSGPGGEQAMLAELRTQLPRALSQGRYRRVGAASRPLKDETLVIVALQETGIELEPVARALPANGGASLRGRLLSPFERPEAMVTGPEGQVTRLQLGGDATRFSGTFRCGPRPGRYQIEVNGFDRFGATVLANFPVYCGVAAPTTLPASGPSPEEKLTDAPGAEAALLKLVNADRARAKLPPLASDARLRDVARAHSADMREHGFVGHVSPTTGSAADRLKRAGVGAQLILENVARAYSPAEAERGLMESPGHRANLLNREVTLIGIGVVTTEGVGGARELLVTQLFTRPIEKLDARSTSDLRRRIDELRRVRRLPALGVDAALDRVAQSTAEELARGALKQDRAGEPLERALGTLASHYKAMRSVVAVGAGTDGLVDGMQKALVDAGATTCGIGLAAGKRPDGSSAIFAVIVLATRR